MGMKYDKSINIRFVPWIYFLFFLVADTVLSFFDLSLTAKLEFFLCGIFAPMILAMLGPPPRERGSLWSLESFPRIPLGLWVLAGLTGLFLRFYHLTALSNWPFPDEGAAALQAQAFSQNGAWHFFYGSRLHPPLFYLLFGWFLKWVPLSLDSLWLFPGILSALTMVFAFFAARTFFSKFFAFLFGLSMATGFWPIYTGRLCSIYALAFLFEFLAFWLLGLYGRQPKSPAREKFAWAMGLCVGLGFFTSILWPMVAFAVAAAFLLSRLGNNRGESLGFFLPASLGGAAFAFLYSTHAQSIQESIAFGPGMNLGGQITDSLAYLETLFWGVHQTGYGPVWGGLLNPVFGSLVFLGLSGCVGKNTPGFYRWALAGLVFFILPAFLSRGLETFRVLFVFPFLAVFAVSGMLLLVSDLKKYRLPVLCGLLAASALLDFYHLQGPYHRIWGIPGPAWTSTKSTVAYNAYLQLGLARQREGNGLVLSDLRPFGDPTLEAAVYPFDATQNPGLRPEDARWAAVMVSDAYRPFLSKRLPSMRWVELGKDHPWDRQDWFLGLLPVEDGNRAVIRSWVEMNRSLRSVTDKILNQLPWDPQKPILDRLQSIPPAVMGNDRFLWSCYLDRTLFYYGYLEKDYGQMAQVLGEDLSKAYPLPYLLHFQTDLSGRANSPNRP
jgi:hypothetical protein